METQSSGLPDERAEALLRIIGDSWDTIAAESEWADRVHLSRYYFQRVFLRTLGETPGELRRRLLLERAAHTLCATLCSVTDIAFDSGYDSFEGFSRAFRHAYGVSPSHYRRIPFPRVQLPSASHVHYDPIARKPRKFNSKGVTPMDLTDRLIDHDAWLTRRILEHARTLSDAQLDAPVAKSPNPLPFESPEGTLREVLNRMVFTKENWLAAARQRPFRENADQSAAGMLKRLDATFIEFAELAYQIRDENRWDDTFVDATCEPPETFTYGGMMAHVITFSAFRRSVALKIMETLGVNGLGYGDPIEWERKATAKK